MNKQSQAVIIDVRTPQEFAEAKNPKSINVPLDELEQKLSEISQTYASDQLIVLCCASGGRSSYAQNYLRQNGFTNVQNAGPWQNTLKL